MDEDTVKEQEQLTVYIKKLINTKLRQTYITNDKYCNWRTGKLL